MFRLICMLAFYAAVAQCRSLHDIEKVRSQLNAFPSSPGLWEPPNGQSREEWMQCHGQPADVCLRTREKLAALKKLISSNTPHQPNDDQEPQAPAVVPTAFSMERGQDATLPRDDTLDGCIWLTEEQIDTMMLRLNNDTTTTDPDVHSRKKRTLTDFTRSPFSRWSTPITYKFDGTHSIYQMASIRDAFSHWSDNTCVRFNEVPTNQEVSTNHILITSANTGCHSYVGRIGMIPQQLNLQDACIYHFGIPVHEIGHSLGMWHEQMRSDRDDWIRINWENVYSPFTSQYQQVDTLNLAQYDYGSVMHYSPQGGSSSNGKATMQSHNPLYQGNMGQRTGLSFGDIKAINLAYCADKCSPSSLARPCEHGGYQNPNNCYSCICPDGFDGTYCDQLAKSTYAECGAVVNLASGASHTIKSPGYDNDRYYLSYQGCNWWIKAPKDHTISLQFVGDFGVFCSYRACFHWVEVKYKADLGLEGPRFCCYDRPNSTVHSESNEMMVVFKSNFSNDYLVTQRGFQAIVKAVPAGSSWSVSEKTPPPTTTKATTTTTTTTSSTTKECSRRELALILDSSYSVSGSDWSKLTSFVGRLVADLRRRDVVNRVAVVTYSQRAHLALSLGYADANELSSLPLSSGSGRNVAGALRLTRTSVLEPANTLSSGLLVTTGGATVDRHQTLAEADAARSSRLGIVVLGVGSVVNGSEAAAIATRADDGVVYADSFDHLFDTNANFADLLTEKICESDKPSDGVNVPSTQLWSCSFEQKDNPLCGMTQEYSRDQFDWIVHTGATPSRVTGPEIAYHGYYYAYIEASNPRQPNDEAWLILPKLDYSGVVCVDFYYHMFGFHVKTLRLVQQSTTSAGEVSRTVWMRSRAMGNVWHHGNSQVDISPNSELMFIATRGDAFSGDIAIDNIIVNTGACR